MATCGEGERQHHSHHHRQPHHRQRGHPACREQDERYRQHRGQDARVGQVPPHHRVLLDAALEVARRVHHHARVALGHLRSLAFASSTKRRAKSRSAAVPAGLMKRYTSLPSSRGQILAHRGLGQVLVLDLLEGGRHRHRPRLHVERIGRAARSPPAPRIPCRASGAAPPAAAANRCGGRSPRRSGAPRSGPAAASRAGPAVPARTRGASRARCPGLATPGTRRLPPSATPASDPGPHARPRAAAPRTSRGTRAAPPAAPRPVPAARTAPSPTRASSGPRG